MSSSSVMWLHYGLFVSPLAHSLATSVSCTLPGFQRSRGPVSRLGLICQTTTNVLYILQLLVQTKQKGNVLQQSLERPLCDAGSCFQTVAGDAWTPHCPSHQSGQATNIHPQYLKFCSGSPSLTWQLCLGFFKAGSDICCLVRTRRLICDCSQRSITARGGLRN